MTDTMQPPSHHHTKLLLCAVLLEIQRTAQVFQHVCFSANTSQCTAVQVLSGSAGTERSRTYYQTQHIIQGYFNQLRILFRALAAPK